MLKIEFPLRTKSVNGSWGHWTAHASQVKAQRNRVRLELLKAKKPGPHFVVILTRISPGRLDDDNLRGALKGCRDQVACWLGVDDGGPLVRWEYRQERGDHGVRIVIGYAPEIPTHVVLPSEIAALPGGDE